MRYSENKKEAMSKLTDYFAPFAIYVSEALDGKSKLVIDDEREGTGYKQYRLDLVDFDLDPEDKITLIGDNKKTFSWNPSKFEISQGNSVPFKFEISEKGVHESYVTMIFDKSLMK